MKTIELFVKIKVDHLKSIIERFITILCFEPQNMDVYYNEFKKMKYKIPYSANVMNALSVSELDGGITGLTLYPPKTADFNNTMDFRIHIYDTSFENGQVRCSFEWTAMHEVRNNYINGILNLVIQEGIELIYLLAYDYLDANHEMERYNGLRKSSNPITDEDVWGRRELENRTNFSFVAAPIMYYGKEYYSIVPQKALLSVSNSQVISIMGHEIISIKLFDINEPPSKHREMQKAYWISTSLERCIMEYRKKQSFSAFEYFKQRAEKWQMRKR